MMMKRTTIWTAAAALLFVGCTNSTETTQAEHSEADGNEMSALKIDNLLRDTLEIVEGLEVIMSYVEVPKNTTMPYHYHPGEEFAYLLEGSGVLILKDHSQMPIKAGEAGKVPLKQVHTFSSAHEGAKMVVFRVHEQGQPERILAE